MIFGERTRDKVRGAAAIRSAFPHFKHRCFLMLVPKHLEQLHADTKASTDGKQAVPEVCLTHSKQ